VDWDNDGKKDMVAGDTNGAVWLFLNTGTAEKPKLAKGRRVEADGKAITSGSHRLAEVYSKLHMADWDGDGLKDLLIGYNNTIVMYKNAGTPSAPRFKSPTKISTPERNFPTRPSPYVVDWDGDGSKDLLVGTERSSVHFYRNTGTNTKPQLARGKVLDLKVPKSKAGYRWRIEVTDWNNDGRKDILAGNYFSRGGNIWLFLGK
jgi:hypothetical protein